MNATESTNLDSVDVAVAAIADGEMIVVVDDADRENEGDLIVAASKATAEQIAFMIRHTSGIVCTPLTQTEARRLKLDPMVAMNDAPLGTAFTISIDYKIGLTTGISAEERCNTVRALANGNAAAEDFVRPGHVFPLIAKQGGTLMRSGHTEAAVDLAKLAGLPPVGVLAELVNDDGTVKRGEQVMSFAREHGFKIISVADLIAYRQVRERLGRADGGILRRHPDRDGPRHHLFDSVRRHPAPRPDLRSGRRRRGRDHPAPCREHRRRRVRPAPCPVSELYQVRAERPRRAGLSARGRGRRPGDQPDRRRRPERGEHPERAGPQTGMARRRVSAPRSCATSASSRSACSPPATATMSACRASASRSMERNCWTVEAKCQIAGSGPLLSGLEF